LHENPTSRITSMLEDATALVDDFEWALRALPS
jgi:hypothetical protein